MFLRNIARLACVLWLLTALLLTVEGTSKQIRLYAVNLVLIQNAKNVSGPSKIYTIETFNLTNTTRNESILQLSLLKHQLLPGDKLTFYNGNFTSALQEYTASTETPALSFFTTLPDAKVVFTANTSNVNTTRSFIFLYRTVPKDTGKACNHIFYGRWGNIDSSKHDRGSKRCRYTVTLPLFNIYTIILIFDNLTIPVGDRLWIWKTTGIDLQSQGNPKVFNHVNNGKVHYIAPDYMEALILEFNSTTQFEIRFQEFKRVIEEFGESGELTIPVKPFQLKYWITVPRGHVKLTIHDLYLPNHDTVDVYRFNDRYRRREMVRRFDNSTTLDINTVVSDSNRLAVTYNPRREYSTGSVRMTYSMLENAPQPCKSSFPNAKKYPLFSELYEGWEETYACASGYGNKNFNRFTVLCQGNGSWTYRKGGECRKICPSPDSLYDLSSHGLYTSLDLETPHLSGDNVTFSCKTPFPRLNNVTVTCTSSGTYSAPPPYCTEREKQSSDADLVLILSLSLSVAFVICAVAIVYCILRYTTCVNEELRVKLFGPGVVNSQQPSIELQGNGPPSNGAKDSNVV